MSAATQSARSDAAVYRWEPPEKGISVLLSYQAANQILSDAIRGLGLVPRRGLEVGGILLGTAEAAGRRLVRIEEIVPISCEHASGPSFVLSEKDRAELALLLAQHGTRVVGFYRSHTRDALALSEEDLLLLSACFPEPSQVALLVKPHPMRPSPAGFFFREEGNIRSESTYLEFELERRAVPEAAAPAVTEESPQAAELPLPSFLETAPEPPGRLRAWWQRRKKTSPEPVERAPRGQPLWSSWWVQVPLLTVLVAVDGVLGYIAAQRFPIHLPTATSAEDPYGLHLLVLEYGNNLHLTWDRNAPAIVQARRAVLSIRDGDQNRQLELAAPQLHSGSVIYRRFTSQVQFRLEVFVNDKESVAESWELGANSRPGRASYLPPAKEPPR